MKMRARLGVVGAALLLLLSSAAPGFGAPKDYKGPACADINSSEISYASALLGVSGPDVVTVTAKLLNICVGADGAWGTLDDEVAFSATAFLYQQTDGQLTGTEDDDDYEFRTSTDVPSDVSYVPASGTDTDHDVIFTFNVAAADYDGACYEVRSLRHGRLSDAAPDQNEDGSASHAICTFRPGRTVSG